MTGECQENVNGREDATSEADLLEWWLESPVDQVPKSPLNHLGMGDTAGRGRI